MIRGRVEPGDTDTASGSLQPTAIDPQGWTRRPFLSQRGHGYRRVASSGSTGSSSVGSSLAGLFTRELIGQIVMGSEG
jgi:hypothetical protein